MKEVANTFKDSEFGHRVGLWNHSKVRNGGEEGGGQESSLRPSFISVLSCTSPFSPSFSPLILLSLITNRFAQHSLPSR